MFDCHIHSNFSNDSCLDATEACDTALKMGLLGIAFTDHLDIDYPGSDESWFINYDDYFEKISSLRMQYKGKLNILTAIEVGIQPHVIDEALKIVENREFDYVLASVHVVNKVDPYARLYYKDKSKYEAYELYLKEIYFMLTHYDNFDMLGHFEYITRYAQYIDRSLRYADHSDIFDSILKETILKGRGFEVNTATFKYSDINIEYDTTVLKRYRELGGELICLGSDAHRVENIGHRFDYFSQIIKDSGFKFTVHYENRKPVYDKI